MALSYYFKQNMAVKSIKFIDTTFLLDMREMWVDLKKTNITVKSLALSLGSESNIIFNHRNL